jgi:hypothetical protein
MLETDTLVAARSSAARLSGGQMRQFYDRSRWAGKMIAEMLTGADATAWDSYLFYRPGAAWIGELPQPAEWIHQLTSAPWAGPARFYTGQALRDAVAQCLRQIVGALPM